MKLILLRHGLAVSRDEFMKTKKDDTLRPLVPRGREKTELMARQLKQWIGHADMLVTSPYVRAKQTAMIVKSILKPREGVVEAVELIPSAPPMAFAQWLRGHAALATSIVVVGHEPQLDLFATWCLSGQLESFIKIKKSGVVGLEIENFQELGAGTAELKFLLSPAHLEDLRGA
jgi:phosphohistidine phosphatase